MYKSQENRIESVVIWLEKDIEKNRNEYSNKEEEYLVKVILKKVRSAFYTDYSLWDHDYDFLERIVRRKVKEDV